MGRHDQIEDYIVDFLSDNPKIKELIPVGLDKFLKSDILKFTEFSKINTSSINFSTKLPKRRFSTSVISLQ